MVCDELIAIAIIERPQPCPMVLADQTQSDMDDVAISQPDG